MEFQEDIQLRYNFRICKIHIYYNAYAYIIAYYNVSVFYNETCVQSRNNDN